MSAGLDEFRRLRASFQRAADRLPGGVWRGVFAFARRPVRFDVVGPRLATSIERAFASLAAADQSDPAPLLRVEVWDEHQTGVVRPVHCDGGRSSDGGRIVIAGSEAWVGAYDRERRHLVAAVRAGASVHRIDHGRLFERLLLIWYHDQGCLLLHAGMVVPPGGEGILLPGVGQSGKSTTVFACTQGGFDALGDDCIALERRSDSRFTGFAVSSSIFVESRVVRLFGGLGVPEPADARAREIIFLPADRTAAVCAGVPAAAIVVPHVTPGAASALTRIGRAEALRILLASAMAADPGGITHRGFADLTALLDQVPCYRLAAGSDLRAIPAAVGMALEGTTRRCGS